MDWNPAGDYIARAGAQIHEKGIPYNFSSVPELSGKSVVQIVSDSGIGMTADQIAKLFQAFSQADDSVQKKFGGTGLGLVLCRNFCQMMGGDVTVASEYGAGSTFTVRLPADSGLLAGTADGALGALSSARS